MLWRVRTALPDRPGALAVLAQNCGAAGVNILGLQIFPDMGSVTDELVLRTPADWGIPEIGRLVELSGGRAISSTRCTEAALTDQPTRFVQASRAVLAQPASFPAVVAQLFDAEADPAENYGGIGAVIGHEIGHGFDDQGSEYDEHGNLNEWWTEADKLAFKERADQLIQQYDGYEPRDVPGEHVNGALTVGENIGDLGGLTIALKAYRIFLGDDPVPERDGLTGVQRLFLNWAYVWRTKRRKEQEQQYLTIDPHSPPEFRANIVRNLDEFHEVFETAEGDGLWLDPAERVRIW